MEKLSYAFITSASLILFIVPTCPNRQYPSRIARSPSWFLFFNASCGLGIVFAVLLLHLFHARLGWNLYLSNLLTIVLVTLWNFGMNAKFHWTRKANHKEADSGQRVVGESMSTNDIIVRGELKQ